MAIMTQAPGRRLAYHLDGTQVSYFTNLTTATVATQTQLNYINDIDATTDEISVGSCDNFTYGLVFPQKYNIYKYFLNTSVNIGGRIATLNSISVSTDTTDGINGVWTILTTPTPNGHLHYSTAYGVMNATQWFDDSYVSGTLSGAVSIKGIKFYFTTSSNNTAGWYLKVLNLYGEVNDTSATQRVAFTDNSGVALTQDNPPFTVKRGDTNIQSLYLKNLHSTATSKIDFAIDGEITTVNNAVTISVDGGTTYNALPYTWTTSLAAGAVSSEIKVKYIVPVTETYGLKYFGINAKPTFV